MHAVSEGSHVELRAKLSCSSAGCPTGIVDSTCGRPRPRTERTVEGMRKITQGDRPNSFAPRPHPISFHARSLSPSRTGFDWSRPLTDSAVVCPQQVTLLADVLFIWHPSECPAHSCCGPLHLWGNGLARCCVSSSAPAPAPQSQPSVRGAGISQDDMRHSFGIRPPVNTRTKAQRFPRVRARPSASWFRLWVPGL